MCILQGATKQRYHHPLRRHGSAWGNFGKQAKTIGGHLHTQEIGIAAEAFEHRKAIDFLVSREDDGERLLPGDALALVLALQFRRVQAALPQQTLAANRTAQVQRQGPRGDLRVLRQVQGVRHQPGETGQVEFRVETKPGLPQQVARVSGQINRAGQARLADIGVEVEFLDRHPAAIHGELARNLDPR